RTGSGGRAGGSRRDGNPWIGGHLLRPRPKTRANIEKPVAFATFRHWTGHPSPAGGISGIMAPPDGLTSAIMQRHGKALSGAKASQPLDSEHERDGTVPARVT